MFYEHPFSITMTLDKFGRHILRGKKQVQSSQNVNRAINNKINQLHGLLNVIITGKKSFLTEKFYDLQDHIDTHCLSVEKAKIVKFNTIPAHLPIVVDGMEYDETNIATIIFKKDDIIKIPVIQGVDKIQLDLLLKYPLVDNQ